MNKSVIRDLLAVMSGTAGAQLLGLLVLPLLARLYAPAAFGIYQFYLSLLIFISIGATLRIELTLLSRSPDKLEDDLQHLIGLTVVVAVIVAIGAETTEFFTKWAGFPIGLLGVGLLGNGITQIASYRLIREKSFNRLAILKFVQVFTYSALALLIALVDTPLWGLIVADILGRIIAALVALWSIATLQSGRWPIPSFRGLLSFIRRNWELPVFSLPGALTNSAGALLTPLLIFKVYGAAAAGQFGLADRSLGAPIAMVITAGSQVYSGQLVHHLASHGAKATRSLFLRLVSVLLFVSAFGAIVAYEVLPEVFPFVFGSGWSTAAQIAEVMIFAYSITFVSGLTNQTLIVLKAFRLQSFWDISRTTLIAAAWGCVLVWGLSLMQAITIYASIIAGMGLVFIILCSWRLQTIDKINPVKPV